MIRRSALALILLIAPAFAGESIAPKQDCDLFCYKHALKVQIEISKALAWRLEHEPKIRLVQVLVPINIFKVRKAKSHLAPCRIGEKIWHWVDGRLKYRTRRTC